MINPSASFSKAKRSNRARATAIGLGALLFLSGCCIPELQKACPGPPTPDTFNGVVCAENTAQICWNEFFNDPILVGLISEALVGNQELRILNQDIQIANFEVLARSGEYLPFVGLRGGAGLEKPSLFTPLGAAEDQLQPVPGVNFPEPLPNFLVAADVSWEIDIWRRLRNARDAATLRYLGTAEGRNYMVTRLVAEVAENYYELMALDNRMQTLDRTIQIQERSVEVSKLNKQAGRDTELPVQRFLAEVRKNQSEKLIIQQQIVETENRINFLLGRYPQPVARDSSRFIDLNLHALSVGVPAQLMQNRADIREAERELAAAGLDVRVARARFYPSLSISAGVGYEAFNPRYLFNTPESLIYNVAGNLVGPVINRRAIRADYLTANARQLQAVYDYQRTVLNAFTEVVNRMSKVQNYRQSIDIKRQQLSSLEQSVDLASKLFQAAHPGVEYVDVLLAQRDLMEARMVLIETKQQQLTATIYAYQALGGGGALPNGVQPFVEDVSSPLLPVEEVPPGQQSKPDETNGPMLPPVQPAPPITDLPAPLTQNTPPPIPNHSVRQVASSMHRLPPVLPLALAHGDELGLH